MTQPVTVMLTPVSVLANPWCAGQYLPYDLYVRPDMAMWTTTLWAPSVVHISWNGTVWEGCNTYVNGGTTTPVRYIVDPVNFLYGGYPVLQYWGYFSGSPPVATSGVCGQEVPKFSAVTYSHVCTSPFNAKFKTLSSGTNFYWILTTT